ncbi:MAG: hypothetical protein K2J85_00845, partial [Anaeroplasmataceae bacterium]|nr:hypothetical protein [Anaeroplasmataceae bacterium]
VKRMYAEEFMKIKNELIELVIEFEQTERKINLLSNAYMLEFYEELQQQRYLLSENDYLIKAIAMKNDGKSKEEIKAFLEDCRKQFSANMQGFYTQYRMAQELGKKASNLSENDMNNMDEAFIEYCSVHHPLIKAHSTPEDRSFYSTLIMLYRMGNVMGFKKFLKECKFKYSSHEITEEEYNNIAKLYLESIDNLKEISQKKKQEFPLNKEDIFYKEELLTRELMYLREKNYKAREMNKALQADFKLHFSFEFTL